MNKKGFDGAELPPPPPNARKSTPQLPLMARKDYGTKGQKNYLLTNHFHVELPTFDDNFYQYSVKIAYEDGTVVETRGIGRKVLDKLHETYESELGGKQFAYDGEKTLFTLGKLSERVHKYDVILEEQQSNRLGKDPDDDSKRIRRTPRSKKYKVELNYATTIQLKAIENALRGQDSEHFQEAVRVFDTILRQHAARKGCLLVRQSFFRNEPQNYFDISGGANGCRGFHSSFRVTECGLSLNIDVSTTITVQPGPVLDFLMSNQNVTNPHRLDWTKAKRTLKSLRIVVRPSNMVYKITGLSDNICDKQLFELRQRNDDGESQTVKITVYDYFVKNRNIILNHSGYFPCINVGKPKRPTYFPIELCDLVSLQRYTKSLSGSQRTSLVEKSRQKPQERMTALIDALSRINYKSDPMIKESGIDIKNQFRVEGRVLQPPQLTFGNGKTLFPQRARWNFNDKVFFKHISTNALENWIIVNFSARVDMNSLIRDIVKCGQDKGMVSPHLIWSFEISAMSLCHSLFLIWKNCHNVTFLYKFVHENRQNANLSAPERVQEMMKAVKNGTSKKPQFILCLLPEKNSDIYGPWKRITLAYNPDDPDNRYGIANQCMSITPGKRLNHQYFTNILLKINAKLGGLNSVLSIEYAKNIPHVFKIPTVIFGMDVSHGSPGRNDVPSIAAVVGSLQWPSVSCYKALVRTQSPKAEMIDGLFKPVPGTNKDDGMFWELINDFYQSSGRVPPKHIVIFRDGVSESQFSHVLNIELDQMKKACKFNKEGWFPKFTLIVAQKNHHTRFFVDSSPNNVLPGTVVDKSICHPKNNDFYMCAHAGMIGTTRPTHYHVLHDEIGFSADELQDLVHSLSYVYQRSTTAISVVAPVRYAHQAASQIGQFMKFDEFSETSSSQEGVTSAGSVQVPLLPMLHPQVRNSMFFC